MGTPYLYLLQSVHQCHQWPLERLGTNISNKTVEATECQSAHINMRYICPRVKNKFCLHSNDFGFICAGMGNMGGYKIIAWYKLQLSVTNLLPFEHQQKTCLLADCVSVCVCVCVCVCVRACVHAACMCVFILYAFNLENMCIYRMCERLGPVLVRHSKYPLLLLFSKTYSVTNYGSCRGKACHNVWALRACAS